MSESRRIIMSSFMMLLLHFPAADVKDNFCIVRVGHKVALPFENVIHDQDECNSTTWLFSDSRSSVTLFEYGRIHNDAKAKSARMRVEKNCSLVIKKVTEEDAGRYTCTQYISGNQQGHGSYVGLSVVTLTEHQDTDEVTLDCSVSTNGDCRDKVKWLLQGRDVDKDHRDIKTSQSSCSASVTFLTSHFSNTTRSELFTCEVRDGANVQTFSPQTSGEDRKPATTNRPPPTTTTTTAKNNINSGGDAGKGTTVSTTWTTVEIRTKEKTKNASDNDNNQTGQDNKGWWWWIIVVIVGVAALTIITVAVIRRKRTQGTDTETDDNVADPEDGVSYASISYTRKSSRKARAHLHDDDEEDDAVTYSTVRAPSSSSAASADPSLLYATVNKPRKKPM
ncbi:uncharacterized protein LOC117482514 isoform X1 [Trematomus bernacchii]|uniref:uncharacterized protein LOC117482514 isoform X1 n=1 Tax=Trematomus bernacchii TaxID=40690 RepID=UPI00146EBFE2|nr:uncharacterized protein LOC117482514 isoform X1 [Trematomus bernacchii]